MYDNALLRAKNVDILPAMFWNDLKKNENGSLALHGKRVSKEKEGVPIKKVSSQSHISLRDDAQFTSPSARFIFETYGSVALGLSANISVKGNMHFDTPVLIEGKLDGGIFSNSVVILTENATVKGVIRAKDLHVFGALHADVRVSNLFQLFPNACYEGNLQARFSRIHHTSRCVTDCVIGESSRKNIQDFSSFVLSDTASELLRGSVSGGNVSGSKVSGGKVSGRKGLKNIDAGKHVPPVVVKHSPGSKNKKSSPAKQFSLPY